MSEVYGYPTILLSDGTREFIGGGNGEADSSFCPNCGADMRGEQDG